MGYPMLQNQLLSLCFSAALCVSSTLFGMDLYVAPSGNDANAGTRQAPFASVAKARDAIRGTTARNEPVTVHLAAGTYYLPDTVVFESQDSGTKESPITYSADADGQVVLSGGSKLSLTWTFYSCRFLPKAPWQLLG